MKIKYISMTAESLTLLASSRSNIFKHIFEAYSVHSLSFELPDISTRDLIKLTLQSVCKVNPLDILSQSSPLPQDQIKLDSAGLIAWIIQNSFGKRKVGIKSGHTVYQKGLFDKIHH